MWDRLTPEATQVLRYAFLEAREFGPQLGRAPWTYSYLGDEHVLLGILRHADNPAARLMGAHGVRLAEARQRLRAIGPTLPPLADGAAALRALGVDPDELRSRLRATFGEQAVAAAERRVRRRPWWRGGRQRWARPCTFLLAKRAFDYASTLAAGQGRTLVSPQDLLYGVLRDSVDPVGTQLSRKGRKQLSEYGWQPGLPNPLRLLLQSHDLDPARLCAEQGWPGSTGGR